MQFKNISSIVGYLSYSFLKQYYDMDKSIFI